MSLGEDTNYLSVYYRVNLIGEHVDYSGYSVLPMAIQYDVMMAVKRLNEPQLYLTNMDYRHTDFQCPINSFRYANISNYSL
jgi:N-acetylgalactosamine kinase